MVQPIFPLSQKSMKHNVPPCSFVYKGLGTMGHLFFNNRGLGLSHGITKGHAYRMPARVNSTSNPVT